MVMTRIILRGELGDRFTPELEFDVATTQDALAALRSLYPGFKAYMLQQARLGISYQVTVGDAWTLEPDQLSAPTAGQPIVIAPVLAGETKALPFIGAALLVASAATGVGLVFSASTTYMIAATLAVQGLRGLFPTPGVPKPGEEDRSLMMSGVVNTDKAAGDIYQIVFGRRIRGVGSQVVSAGITASFTPAEPGDDDSL